MIESFVPGLLPPHVATVAWCRNWTSAWAALPYFAQAEVTPALQPALILPAVAGALTIGLLASWYPIRRAARLDPTEAVRYV